MAVLASGVGQAAGGHGGSVLERELLGSFHLLVGFVLPLGFQHALEVQAGRHVCGGKANTVFILTVHQEAAAPSSSSPSSSSPSSSPPSNHHLQHHHQHHNLLSPPSPPSPPRAQQEVPQQTEGGRCTARFADVLREELLLRIQHFQPEAL